MNPANVNQIASVVAVASVKYRMKNKITPQTKLSELLKINPESAGMLFESGMGCVGCPMAMQETIEDGCLAHGMSKKDIDELIKKLNKNKRAEKGPI